MSPPPEVLHYVGCDHDRGGILSVIRNLAAAERFRCVLGVNPGCVQSRQPPLPVLELPRIAGEKISPATIWRSRAVARAVQAWLQADPVRVFHGHSRAGLLVGLWLARWGERRVVVSVHCYGRQRWFYRWAAQQLGARLFWLSPAMKKYYGAGDDSWTQCIPGCLAPSTTVTVAHAPDPAGRIRLGGIGALVRWKRWDLALAALGRLPAELRGRFIFRHIGADDGSTDGRAYASELHHRADAADLAGRVAWLGQQASSEIFLAGIDCLVVTSHNEPFSIAMLEALQAGMPVIASDSGGARDVIGAGRNGWLFRDGDADDCARRLARLAAGEPAVSLDPAEIVRRFGAAGIAGQWMSVYQSLAAS